MIIACVIGLAGAFLIYKLVSSSLAEGKNDGLIMAGLIAVAIFLGVAAITSGKPKVEEPRVAQKAEKPAPPPAIETRSAPSSAVEPAAVVMGNTQVKTRIKNYLTSLPGAVIVTVRGDDDGIIVDCDFDFGTADKEAAKTFAQDLIYRIMGDNSDVQFKWLSVNCMNGKAPAGIIVQYENGRFSSLP